jgi:hypothetical protein
MTISPALAAARGVLLLVRVPYPTFVVVLPSDDQSSPRSHAETA